MVSRKTILLTVSVIGVVAAVAAMSVQAQDEQQSSRRTHRPAEQGTPTPAGPASNSQGSPTPASPTPASPTPANPMREPVADPFANAGGTSSTADDPFARQAQRPEPRPFGSDAGTQLPSQSSQSGGAQMPGALVPDEGANALQPVPNQAAQTNPTREDPFASSRAPTRIDESDPFGHYPQRPAPSTGSGVTEQNAPTNNGALQSEPVQDHSANLQPQATQESGPFDRFATRSVPRTTRGAAVTGSATLLRQQAPSLLVETKGPEEVIVGREAVLRVQVFNEGDLVARDVLILLELPADVELTSAQPTGGQMETASTIAGGTQWRIPAVNPGGGESLTLKVIPKSARPLDVKMKWTTAPAEASTVLNVLEPKLQLAVTGPKEIGYGEKAVYTMTFSNPGTADAEDVEVMLMPLEPGSQPETHEIGTIAAGDKRDVEIELVPKQTGTLQIRAQATAVGGLVSQVSEDILIRRAGIDVQLEGPNFRYAKTPATYRLKVTNPGNAPTAGLQVGAILPPGAKLVSATQNGQEEEGGRVRWRLDNLAPGKEMYLEVRCELIQAGPNRLTAVALADGDLRAEHEFTTDVEALADLNLNVRDPKGPVPVGEETEYEIVITNRGTKAAEGIEIAAYFSNGIEPVSVSGATHQLQPGMVVLGPLPVLAADDQTIIKVRARADNPGNHQFRVELHCEALDTKLAEQKMTRFYGDARNVPKSAAASPLRSADQSTGGVQTQQPIPQSTGNGDRYSNWPANDGAGSGESIQEQGSDQPTPLQPVPTAQDSDQSSGDRYADRYSGGYRGSESSAGQPTPADQQSSRRQPTAGQPTPADGQ